MPEFLRDSCPKMPEFYTIIARKKQFFPIFFFGGGGGVRAPPPSPVSFAYGEQSKLCDDGEYFLLMT